MLKFFSAITTLLLINCCADLCTAEELKIEQKANIYTADFVRENDLNLGRRLARNYLTRTPIAANPNLSLARAIAVQEDFVSELIAPLGRIVGYKAGLTNPQAQARFQVSSPLSGVLLDRMLLPSSATVPANYGIRPIVEGDLMVRVGSSEINDADTPQEALAALDAVIPFLELADLVYAPEVQLDAPAIAAINVGARLGIMGTPIPLTATPQWQERLVNIRLELVDRSDRILAKGHSSALLGDPLAVVLWLKNDLNARGKRLQPGDLLSLGTITPPVSISPNTTIRARYANLNPSKKVEISVNFE